MRKINFAIDDAKSTVTSLGWPSVKPNTKLPLVVPLRSGGTVSLAIDEKTNAATGRADHLRFETDRFKACSMYGLTGKHQLIAVKMSDLNLTFDSKGKVTSSSGYTFVYGAQMMGGAGSLALWYSGPSKLVDGNSSGFDLTNGLGCGGRLVLEMGTGNPTSFIIHVEADVAIEDANGDGKFDTFCPVGDRIWFKLDYEPPKLRIFPPEVFGRGAWWEDSRRLEAIPLHDLVRRAAGRTRGEPIHRIELVSSPDMAIYLLDRSGRVLDGAISNRRTKHIEVPTEPSDDLVVAIGPAPGVAVMERR